jgi:hypothetical protein
MKPIPSNITTGMILEALKARIYSKLQEEPYEDDMGVWHDPLPPQALGQIGNFILKLDEAETKKAMKENAQSKIVSIPALPSLRTK